MIAHDNPSPYDVADALDLVRDCHWESMEELELAFCDLVKLFVRHTAFHKQPLQRHERIWRACWALLRKYGEMAE